MSVSDQTSFLGRHSTKLLVSLVIAVAFWLVLRGGGLPVVPNGEDFAGVRWWTVVVYALSVALWSFIRAMRTRHLLRAVADVTDRQVLTVSWIGFLSIFVLPFRLGEVVRPALFHHKGKLSFATATGACGAERIIDGLFLMTVLGVTLPLGGPLDPLPDHIGKLPIPVVAVPAAAYSMLLLFIAAFTAMALFYWRRAWARRMTDRVVGLISKRLAAFLSGQVEKLSEGFRFLPSPRHLMPYLFETVLYWGIAAGGMWLLAWGCGLEEMTYARSCALLGVLGLGIIVPGAPGYFGAFQASIYAGLALYFAEDVVLGAGSAYVFFLYVSQLGVMFLLAVGAGLLDRDAASAAARADLTAEPAES
jgi:glycosyltransferase 2 family protein